jgi:hypothetical protein
VRTGAPPWLAALGVTLSALILVVLDIADDSVSHWWAQHAFTASIVSGILVLAVTVLIVDRVVSRRQIRDRSRAIAAQAAILMSQATRATRAVISSLNGERDRDAAGEELRTYATMLLIGAPLLIDAQLSRVFLEEAQALAGELARSLGLTRGAEATDELRGRLDAAVQRLRAASRPLLTLLDPAQRYAVTGDDEPPPAAATT